MKSRVLNFQEWAGFPNYTRELHDQGLHLIIIFDPAIEVDYDSFARALQRVSWITIFKMILFQGARFIEWPRADLVPHSVQDQYPMARNTTIMLGNVWPDRNTAFPDFLDPTNATSEWWIDEFVRFHETVILTVIDLEYDCSAAI